MLHLNWKSVQTFQMASGLEYIYEIYYKYFKTFKLKFKKNLYYQLHGINFAINFFLYIKIN